jgi:hypothetical protein
LLSIEASGEIFAVLNKDLKLHDGTDTYKAVYLKKGSTIFIEDKVFSKRGITWYKIKDGYVNSKYVDFVKKIRRLPKQVKTKTNIKTTNENQTISSLPKQIKTATNTNIVNKNQTISSLLKQVETKDKINANTNITN